MKVQNRLCELWHELCELRGNGINLAWRRHSLGAGRRLSSGGCGWWQLSGRRRFGLLWHSLGHGLRSTGRGRDPLAWLEQPARA